MTMTKAIDNNEDIIDSRDVIARIDELQTDITYAFEENDEIPDFDDLYPEPHTPEQIETFGALCDEKGVGDEFSELVTLLDFAEEASGTPDWTYGETCIRESYFEVYAEDLADQTCPSREVSDAMQSWPYRHIDWKAAAEELRYDYFSADFDGVTYLIRQ